MASWSTPHTFGSAEQVSAATLNTYVRDNLQYLYDNRFNASQYGTVPAQDVGSINVGTGWADTGSTVTLDAVGTWLLWGMMDVAVVDSVLATVDMQLTIGGTVQAGVVTARWGNSGEGMNSRWWVYQAASQPLTAKLQARRTGGTGVTLSSDMIGWLAKAP